MRKCLRTKFRNEWVYDKDVYLKHTYVANHLAKILLEHTFVANHLAKIGFEQTHLANHVAEILLEHTYAASNVALTQVQFHRETGGLTLHHNDLCYLTLLAGCH